MKIFGDEEFSQIFGMENLYDNVVAGEPISMAGILFNCIIL